MLLVDIIFRIQFAIVSSVCPTIGEFQKAWQTQAHSRVLELSSCLEASNEAESLRLRSDFLWWSGEYDKSRAIAKRLELANDEMGAHLYRRTHRFRVGMQYSGAVLNDDRFNHEFGGRIGFNYFDANQLFFSYQRSLRSYPGQSQLDDNQYTFGQAFVFNPNIYLEAEFQWTPSPQFSPEYFGLINPHYVFSDSTDIGIGLKLSHYRDLNVWSSALTIRRDLIYDFYGELRGDFLFKPDRALAGQMMIGKNLGLFLIEFKYGGGKSDEGNGILDHFQQTQLRLGWNFLRFAKLIIDSSIYRGGLRDEWKMGSGIECFF